MLWRLLCVALVALLLTPHAEAVKTRRTQVYAASHYVTQGNGGPFTFVASASGGADASGSSVATSSTLDVQTGDLLITLVSFEDGNGSETVSVTDQGDLNPHTITAGDAAYETSNLTSVYPLYRLSGVSHTSATFTATLSTARAFKRIIVMQYRPPTGAVVSKDITGTRKATGNSTDIQTGIFSTQGVHGVVCAMEAIYTGGTHNTSQINGVTAEDTKQQNGAYQWCRRTSSGLTNAVARTQYSASRQWAATVIAFNAEGGTFVDTDPPLAPTSLAGTIGDAQVALTWSHANVPDVHHYSLQYDCGGGYLTWSPAPTSASATITGLANETACTIRVAAVDDAGNVSSYTSPIEKTPTATPIRSAGAPIGSLASGTTSTTLSLTTSKNATCKYSTTAGTAYGSMSSTFTGAGTTSHTTTASGLSDGTTYHYYVRCDDGSAHTNLDDYEITFSVLAVQVAACTDGVNCYCDTISDPNLILCEDYENLDYYENTSNDWAAGSGSPYNRGVNGRWFINYGSNANMGFRSSDPSPRLGTACGLSNCSGLKEFCSTSQGNIVDGGGADCWGPGANSGSCVDIQRSGDFNAELGTLSLTNGAGESSDIGSGRAHLAYRWGIGSTCGIEGTKSFTNVTEIGVTRAIAMSSNFYSTGITGDYLKFEEWATNGGYPSAEYSMLGNFFGVGDVSMFPYRLFMFTDSASDCSAAISNAQVHVGSAFCNDYQFVYSASNAQYVQSTNFPAGRWSCTQSHFTGMGTTNFTIKIWHDGTLVVHISGIDGTHMKNKNYGEINFDSYANTNDPTVGNGDTTSVAYRYEDNLHVRNGPPVSCAAIEY